MFRVLWLNFEPQLLSLTVPYIRPYHEGYLCFGRQRWSHSAIGNQDCPEYLKPDIITKKNILTGIREIGRTQGKSS